MWSKNCLDRCLQRMRHPRRSIQCWRHGRYPASYSGRWHDQVPRSAFRTVTCVWRRRCNDGGRIAFLLRWLEGCSQQRDIPKTKECCFTFQKNQMTFAASSMPRVFLLASYSVPFKWSSVLFISIVSEWASPISIALITSLWVQSFDHHFKNEQVIFCAANNSGISFGKVLIHNLRCWMSSHY